MGEVAQLPNRVCGCRGDGATWADVTACTVHTPETSPLAQAVGITWDRGLAYGKGWRDGYEHAARLSAGAVPPLVET